MVSAGGMYTWWVQRMVIGQFPKTSTAQLLKSVDVTESGRVVMQVFLGWDLGLGR